MCSRKPKEDEQRQSIHHVAVVVVLVFCDGASAVISGFLPDFVLQRPPEVEAVEAVKATAMATDRHTH